MAFNIGQSQNQGAEISQSQAQNQNQKQTGCRNLIGNLGISLFGAGFTALGGHIIRNRSDGEAHLRERQRA